MPRKALHILVLYDLPEFTQGHDQSNYLLNHDERPTERDVCKAIVKMGFKLSIFGIFDDLSAISRVVTNLDPDLIFNLCETFKGDRAHEGHVAGLIEMTGVPMTGSKSDALSLCKDKAITKKILAFDGIAIPKFTMQRRDQPAELSGVSFPAIVKPLNREASEGIAQASVVNDEVTCEQRIEFVKNKLESDVIVEQFIHGREIYIGVVQMGSEIIALPPRELFMKQMPGDKAMVATYHAKWNDEYRKKWGIQTAKAESLSKATAKVLQDDSVKIFKNLGLSGYARMDWRIDQAGKPYFLEANPNPALSQDDDFALAARTAGLSYQKLIMTIIESALPSSKQVAKIS